MNKIYFITYNILYVLLISLSISCNSFAAVDINGSYDSDIKVFGNCKVSLVTLKKGKKFIFLEIKRSNDTFFRIVFDKYKPIGYTEVMPNFPNFPDKQEQNGYANIFIGNRQYNVELNIFVHGLYIIYSMNMPSNFIDLLYHNNEFTIDYSNWGADKLIPVSLSGFPKAMQYVKHLQASL